MRISDWSSDVCSSDLPAALTAATSVVWSFESAAFSTMVLVSYIAAPPTIGFLAAAMPPASASAAAASEREIREIAIGHSFSNVRPGGWDGHERRRAAPPGRPILWGGRSEERRVGKECVSPCG